MTEERGFYEAAMLQPFDGNDLIVAAGLDAMEDQWRKEVMRQLVDLARRVATLETREACDCAGVDLLRAQVDGILERLQNLEDWQESVEEEE